jgi:hypothetical protein
MHLSQIVLRNEETVPVDSPISELRHSVIYLHQELIMSRANIYDVARESQDLTF